MRRLLSFVVILFFVTASVAASARPMKVSVFEASAYAEPRDDADVVQVLIEGVELSAAEEAEDGWLRVRLDTGVVAWMHEGDLKPNRPVPTVIRRAEPARPATAPTHVQVYVKDLDHLAQLVRSDAVVHPMAEDLADSAATRCWVALCLTMASAHRQA